VISAGPNMRSEAGVTLVELLIAMVVMSIGIAAIVAGFSSGIFTTVRAARSSSAGALADQQMEAIRGLNYSVIATTAAPLDGVYNNTSPPYSSPYEPTAWKRIDTLGSCSQNYCRPTRTTTAAGGSYRIDTYVAWKCIVPGSTISGPPAVCSTPAGGPLSRAVKLVTIVVRDGSNNAKTLLRESSTFDQTTG
jgi:prepilin-type N-terminal cleavage/methylation domain-containing protein